MNYGSLRQFWQVDFLHILAGLGSGTRVSFLDNRQVMWFFVGGKIAVGDFRLFEVSDLVDTAGMATGDAGDLGMVMR